MSIDQTSKAKEVEKHPERRFKGALAAFEEREMPNFKRDYPGLRLSQLKDLMYKAFQKSPENPFNQANIVQYNATKDETEELKCKFYLYILEGCFTNTLLLLYIATKKKQIEERLRTN